MVKRLLFLVLVTMSLLDSPPAGVESARFGLRDGVAVGSGFTVVE